MKRTSYLLAFLAASHATVAAQGDLNSLRNRGWAYKARNSASYWKIDRATGTQAQKLQVYAMPASGQPLGNAMFSLGLPIDRVGGVIRLESAVPGQPGIIRYTLIAAGLRYTYDNAPVPQWTGRYCRALIDYDIAARRFTGSVTETVNLGDVDPIHLNVTNSRLVLFDGDRGRLLMSTQSLSQSLPQRQQFTEIVTSFPLGWMNRGLSSNYTDCSRNETIRLRHRADFSRYIKLSKTSGLWTSQVVHRVYPAPNGAPIIKLRNPSHMASPISMPEILIPGSTTQSSRIDVVDANGISVAPSVTVTRGTWTQLPNMSTLYGRAGDTLQVRVDGHRSTQNALIPVARYGRAYSMRSGFEVSNILTGRFFTVGQTMPHGIHILEDAAVQNQTVDVRVVYGLRSSSGQDPIKSSAVSGVDLLDPAGVAEIKGVPIARLSGAFGVDIAVPNDLKVGNDVLLCQYVFCFADGKVAVSDICGTKVRPVADISGPNAASQAAWIAAQLSRTKGKSIAPDAHMSWIKSKLR